MQGPDEKLVYRGLLDDDQQAFDLFFDEFFPRVYRFVLARVGGDAEAAQELCQLTLIRGLQRFASYRGEAGLFTWLCQIARRQINDWWARQACLESPTAFIEDDAIVRAAVESLRAPRGTEPEQAGRDAEVSRLVQVALDQLPRLYGSVLELKYLDGLSIDDVSLRIEQSVLATQALLARARGEFREVFATLAGPLALAGTRARGASS